MPVHIIKKIAPNPANIDPNVAAMSSFTRLLCSLGLLTRYLKDITWFMIRDNLHDEPRNDDESDKKEVAWEAAELLGTYGGLIWL